MGMLTGTPAFFLLGGQMLWLYGYPRKGSATIGVVAPFGKHQLAAAPGVNPGNTGVEGAVSGVCSI